MNLREIRTSLVALTAGEDPPSSGWNDDMLYSAAGEQFKTIGDFFNDAWHNHGSELLEAAIGPPPTSAGTWETRVTISVDPEGDLRKALMVRNANDKLYALQALEVILKVQVDFGEGRLQHKRLGELRTTVTYGETELENSPLRIVESEQEGSRNATLRVGGEKSETIRLTPGPGYPRGPSWSSPEADFNLSGRFQRAEQAEERKDS